MSEPVASPAPPAKRSLLAILLADVRSRDFAIRVMIGAVGAVALGWLGPKWAFIGLVLSQLLADTIKEYVTSRNWSVRRLWFVTALALLFDRIRHRVSASGRTPVAAPLVSTVAATLVVVGAFTAVDTARGQSLLGSRHTTFFGGSHHVTAPSLRFHGRTVTTSTRLTFRRVRVGSSELESLVLTSGSQELRRLRFHVSPAAFRVEHACNHRRRLQVRSSCAVGIVFRPHHSGPFRGRLTISFVEDPELNVPLVGRAVEAIPVTLLPSSLHFAPTMVGQTAPTRTITIEAGNASLPIAGIMKTGSKAFSLIPNHCSHLLLAAKSTCVIQVRFAPLSLGSTRGTLTVTRSDGGPSLKANLSGTGATATPAPPTLLPRYAQFGELDLGNGSQQTRVFTLTAGSTPLRIATIATTPRSGYHATPHHCPPKLPAGQTCMISVTFSPLRQGTESAWLVVTRNGGGPSLRAKLTGSGTHPATQSTLTPTPAPRFKNAQVYTSTPRQTIVFALTPGSSGFPYKSATTNDPKNFKVTAGPTCVARLTRTCKISVTFTPVSYGQKNATLTVTRTDNRKPLTAKLSGVGLAPAILVSPQPSPGSFDFGKVCTQCKMPWATQTFNVLNGGNEPLTIGPITSSDPKHFTVEPPGNGDCSTGQELDPHHACTFNVRFTPISSGPAKPATITLQSKELPQYMFSVTGTGG